MGINNNIKRINTSKIEKSTPLTTSNIRNTVSNINTNININTISDYDVNSSVENYAFDGLNNNQTYTQQLSQMNSVLDNLIKELESEIESLNTNEYTVIGNSADSIRLVYNSSNAEYNKTLNEQLSILKHYKEQIQTQLSLEPYQEILNSPEYNSFINKYNIEDYISDVASLIETGYNVNLYYMNHITTSIDATNAGNSLNNLDQYAVFELMVKNNPNANIETLQAMGNECLMNGISPDGKDYSNPAENYYFMTEQQRGIYHYLFNGQGKQAAEEYISLIQDEINMRAGAYYADRFIQTLDITDIGKLEESLRNFLFTGGKGFVDGVDIFFNGLNNLIMADGKLEASDYEKLYILQYLQNNSNLLDENYQFNSSLGNMIPAMTASAIISCVGTPVAGSMVGSLLMGLSASGNATEQALVDGNDMLNSRIYGLLVGASEATLGYFLGKIPGISRTSSFAIKDFFMEGVEELSQEWLDAGFQAVILGKDVDWSQVPENAIKSFFMGVMMAGITNGGQSIANFTINGREASINIDKTLDYLESHPDTDIIDAIEIVNYNIDEIISNTEAFEIIETSEPIEKVTREEIESYKQQLITDSNADSPFSKEVTDYIRNVQDDLTILVPAELDEDAATYLQEQAVIKKPYLLGQLAEVASQEEIASRIAENSITTEGEKKSYYLQLRRIQYRLSTIFPDLDTAQTQLDLKLADIVSECEVCRRTSVSTLEKCLDSGNIQNQFQTGTSSGIKDLTDRTEVEMSMGVPDDSAYADRPIYGMLFPSSNDIAAQDKYVLEGPGNWYGTGDEKCVIIFNREAIADSTTICIGDSLNYSHSINGGTANITTLNNPKFKGAYDDFENQLQTVESFENMSLESITMSDEDRYIEAQIHGASAHEMTPTNIQKILFVSEPSETLKSKMELAGIPWRVVSGG